MRGASVAVGLGLGAGNVPEPWRRSQAWRELLLFSIITLWGEATILIASPIDGHCIQFEQLFM
jgi:hypothetical protein